jgi:hypothetical protein
VHKVWVKSSIELFLSSVTVLPAEKPTVSVNASSLEARSPKDKDRAFSAPVVSNETSALLPVGRPDRNESLFESIPDAGIA